MKLGCCVGPEYYDLLAETGYDTITLSCRELSEWDEEKYRTVRKKLLAGPLTVLSLNGFYKPGLRLNGKGFSVAELRDYMARLCVRAAGLGVQYIGIGAPAARNIEPGQDSAECMRQFCVALAELCAMARPFGITLLLESVCSLECNFINTTRQAARLVKSLAIDNLGLVYDIYHEYMENQPPEVATEVAPLIKAVHIAQDSENGKRFYLDDSHRDEYRAYLAPLVAARYTGEICVEAFEGDVAGGIRQSHTILRELLEEPGGTE